MNEPATGEALARKVGKFVDDLIINKVPVVAIVADNAGNVQAGAREIASRLPWIFHLPCSSHSLNLIIQDVLAVKETPVAKATDFLYTLLDSVYLLT